VAKETSTILELRKTIREVCLSCHDLISTITKQGLNFNMTRVPRASLDMGRTGLVQAAGKANFDSVDGRAHP